MKNKQEIIKQTALDYDMSISEVEKIYRDNKGLNFYDALELYILNREMSLNNKHNKNNDER